MHIYVISIWFGAMFIHNVLCSRDYEYGFEQIEIIKKMQPLKWVIFSILTKLVQCTLTLYVAIIALL